GGKKTKPTWLAPPAMAASSVSGVERPQILAVTGMAAAFRRDGRLWQAARRKGLPARTRAALFCVDARRSGEGALISAAADARTGQTGADPQHRPACRLGHARFGGD